MSSPAVLSIGEVLWDMFPDAERFGGDPANLASQAALQGAKVSTAAAVGDDDRGRASAISRGHPPMLSIPLVLVTPFQPRFWSAGFSVSRCLSCCCGPVAMPPSRAAMPGPCRTRLPHHIRQIFTR